MQTINKEYISDGTCRFAQNRDIIEFTRHCRRITVCPSNQI